MSVRRNRRTWKKVARRIGEVLRTMSALADSVLVDLQNRIQVCGYFTITIRKLFIAFRRIVGDVIKKG